MALPGFAMGQGSSLNAGSSADMGADYSSKMFQGVTFNAKAGSGADDTIKYVALAVAAVVIAKVLKG